METNKVKVKSPKLAYTGYLFQTFLKRPFGYIVSILYLIYLAVILFIVPKAVGLEPLYIWTLGGFNMPMMNLFFIGGATASIAVAVFRTGRDDGFDLNISAKPFTKGTTVALKTLVYLLIMLFLIGLTILVTSLIMPVFGEYNYDTNPLGIQLAKYQGMLVSVFVGNIVNMLLFGGVSVFISMVGGQVITIIGTVSSVFLIALLNMLYPQMLKSELDVLSDKYDANISSFVCNTLEQYNNPDSNQQPLCFATIQCTDGDISYYDTYEYWTRAESESRRKGANYIDVGKQLSSLFSIKGIDDSRIEQAKKLGIGANSSFNYKIDQDSGLSNANNIENEKYPIACYSSTTIQGMTFPNVIMMGGLATTTLSNITSSWYVISTLYGLDFNSVVVVSDSNNSFSMSNYIFDTYSLPYKTMANLHLTEGQKNAAKTLYDTTKNALTTGSPSTKTFAEKSYETIVADTSNTFFTAGTYDDLEPKKQFEICSKIHVYWATLAQQEQNESIKNYLGGDATFPFNSIEVSNWYGHTSANLLAFYELVFTGGIQIQPEASEQAPIYTHLVTSECRYAETYSNLYSYAVTSFYNNTVIISLWTTISIFLFAASIVVYKKTDFK